MKKATAKIFGTRKKLPDKIGVCVTGRGMDDAEDFDLRDCKNWTVG